MSKSCLVDETREGLDAETLKKLSDLVVALRLGAGMASQDYIDPLEREWNQLVGLLLAHARRCPARGTDDLQRLARWLTFEDYDLSLMIPSALVAVWRSLDDSRSTALPRAYPRAVWSTPADILDRAQKTII